MNSLRGEKLSGRTKHVQLTPELEDALEKMAAFHNRSFNGQLIYVLSGALFGPPELRVLREGKGKNS